MAGGFSITYISLSWIVTSIMAIFVITLLVNYFRKKTVGTMMLTMVYSFFLVVRLFSSLSFTLQISTLSPVYSDILSMISSTSSLFAITFLYLFSCRHILKDSEPVRAFTVFILFSIAGGILTSSIIDAIYDVQIPLFERRYLTPEIYTISLNTVFIILQIAIQTYVFLRVIIRSFVIANKTTQFIRKRGFMLIGWGLTLYFLGGLSGGVLYSITTGSTLSLILWIIRNLVVIFAYFLMYMGWILPDWYRKSIRKKTWIENELKVINA